MKTSSAKAKGARCAIELKERLSKHYPDWNPADLKVATAGETGPDLQLFAEWRTLKYAIECKNVEALNIWSALKQAESHKQQEDETPILVFKRNRTDLYVALSLDDFLKLTK